MKLCYHLLVQIHTAHITPPIPATNASEATIMYTIIQSAEEEENIFVKGVERCTVDQIFDKVLKSKNSVTKEKGTILAPQTAILPKYITTTPLHLPFSFCPDDPLFM